MIETRPFHTAHQLRRTNAVGVGKSNNSPKGRALDAAFKRAQLRSVYAEFDVDIKLGKSRGLSNPTQHNSERLFRP